MHAEHCPVILTYHSISAEDSPLAVAPEMFRQQMEWLALNTRVVSLGEFVGHFSAGRALPPRSVVLTFDDGYADFFSAAAPVMHRLGLPAAVFLPTAYCGKTNAWPGQPGWVKPRPLMSWDQVKRLAAQGVAFGAHSRTHPALDNVSAERMEEEIAGSRADVAAATGQPAEFFCYPYGRWNAQVREVTRRHFRAACSTAAGVVEPDADLFALPRVDAHYVREMKWFARLFTPAFPRYLKTRRWIRRLRGQPEGVYSRMPASTKG